MEYRNNLRELCSHYGITVADYKMAERFIGSAYREADLVLAPDGSPYLFRWHVVPHTKAGNVYFHIQVADDPERPLHDHPWDNMSVILVGGYLEFLAAPGEEPTFHARRAGDTIFRPAAWAHRLLLAKGVPYTMTLFSTGPNIREWGFWYPDGWINATVVCRLDGNVSTHIRKGE